MLCPRYCKPRIHVGQRSHAPPWKRSINRSEELATTRPGAKRSGTYGEPDLQVETANSEPYDFSGPNPGGTRTEGAFVTIRSWAT